MKRAIRFPLAIWMGAAALVFCAAAGAETQWFHITVNERDGDHTKVNIHLPLNLVRTVAPFLAAEIRESNDRHGQHLRIDHREVSVPELREMWRALRDAGDAPFVDVRSDRQTVRISRAGEYLHIKALDGRDKVDIRVPSRVVDALLSGEEGEFEIDAALRVLAEQGAGELVRVDSDDTDVRIWVDGQRPAEESGGRR
jgi:hypothetical protein